MKTTIFSLTLLLAACAIHAQSPQYTAVMTQALTQMDSAQDYQASANTFSRIAAAEPADWLPLYYAAFSQVQQAFASFQQDPARAMQTLDLAQASLDKALALAPSESELAALQGYLLIGRVMENPMAKGAELTPQVFGALGKASALNPENPRAAFLHGTYVLNMPEFYGGGAVNAKPYFEKAAALFEKETDRGLLPHWGRKSNARYLQQVSDPAVKGN